MQGKLCGYEKVSVYGERSVQGSLRRKGKVCIQKSAHVGKSLSREVYEGRKNLCREACVGMEMCKWVGRSLRREIVQEGDLCIYIEICVFMKEMSVQRNLLKKGNVFVVKFVQGERSMCREVCVSKVEIYEVKLMSVKKKLVQEGSCPRRSAWRYVYW